jgi:hypothetical protein
VFNCPVIGSTVFALEGLFFAKYFFNSTSAFLSPWILVVILVSLVIGVLEIHSGFNVESRE